VWERSVLEMSRIAFGESPRARHFGPSLPAEAIDGTSKSHYPGHYSTIQVVIFRHINA
jgi:hypothetical protein